MHAMLAIVALSSSLLLGAEDKVTLAPHFQPDSTFGVYAETTTEQTLTLNGNNVETKAQQIFNVRAKVGKVDDDGNTPIDYHFESVQTDMAFPGGLKVEYDSFKPPTVNDDDPLKIVYELLDAMTKMKWRAVITSKLKVKEVTLTKPEGVTLDPAVDDVISQESLKETHERELRRLPDGPVSVGDTWMRSEVTRLGGGQTMTMEVAYKYEGVADFSGTRVHKITGKVTKVDYVQDADKAGPLRATDAKMKAESSDIILLFDPERGQIIDARSTVRVLGTLTFIAPGDNKIPGKVDFTIKSTAKWQP